MPDIPFLLHRLTRDLSRAGDRMLRAEFGLSYSRALVLVSLDIHGKLSQQELAKWLGSTPPAVTPLVRELVSAGYIQVDPDPTDGRRNQVGLLPEGARLVRASRELLEQRFRVLLDHAGIDGEALESQLRRIADVMREDGD